MHNEKIIYENDKGEIVVIAYKPPFYIQKLEGFDGAAAEITNVQGVGQDGSTVTNVSLKDRELSINGAIKGNTKEEIARFRAKLLRAFSPKTQGWLQYEYGGITKRIRCQVERGPVFKKLSSKLQEFLIDIICPNPYWQDIETNKQEVAIWRGSFEFPLELLEVGIEVGFREPSLIVNIFNNGDVPCGMKIQFKALATLSNPSLFNVNTREYFKINKTMEPREVIVITTNFGNKRVELNHNGIVTNAFNWIDLESSFMQLEPGDNLLRYDADEGRDNLEVSIWYTPQYLGV